MTTSYQLLSVESLQSGRYQPRIDFDINALEELAQSISTQGLIEPIIVREIAINQYEIIAGERRWRAAKLAGLKFVPCLIGHYTEEQAATLTLVENIQRESLNVIEEAAAYKRLIDEFHLQQDEIARLVGKSRSHIANLLRLLTLCDCVQEKIRAGILSLGHARVLVGLAPAAQIELAAQVEQKQWPVRYLEEKVRSLKTGMTETHVAPQSKLDCDINYLQTKLSEQVGAPVQIIPENVTGGLLQIKFFDNDTLAGLLERMGLEYD